MTRSLRIFLVATAAIAAPGWSFAQTQEAPIAEPLAPLPAEAPPEGEAAAPAINEDEMADFLNSQQQIKQDVTLTRTIDGKIVETKKETIVYSKDDPLRGSEAARSPIENLLAAFSSQAITKKEALDEANLDFVIADQNRDNKVSIEEFAFLVKGWEDAEIAGSGSGRFVDPYFHVDRETAAAEHAEQARAKFMAMSGDGAPLGKKAFTRRIAEEFEEHDADKDGLLRAEELLNFRASVRGEPILGR